jgi:hypothetical protein
MRDDGEREGKRLKQKEEEIRCVGKRRGGDGIGRIAITVP